MGGMVSAAGRALSGHEQSESAVSCSCCPWLPAPRLPYSWLVAIALFIAIA